MKKMFRFTDWDYENNDTYGSYEECLVLFNEAVKDNPEGRYSIYDVSEISKGEFKDEGILFNENCPEYAIG